MTKRTSKKSLILKDVPWGGKQVSMVEARQKAVSMD